MQEVICFHCGRIVHISPDAELCSVCGENLRELLHPVYASKYFYDRAAQIAAGGNVLQALQEVDRGLTYQASSELRLLGAILAKRIGDSEQMRQHVGAIPIDDVLRPEGEWLLRSHQTQQRDLREATKQEPPKRRAGRLHDEEEKSVYAADPLPAPLVPTTVLSNASPSHRRRPLYALIIILCVVISSALWARGPQWLATLQGNAFFGTASDSTSDTNPTTDLAAPVRRPTQDLAGETATPMPLPTLEVEPTAEIEDNVVQANTTPEQLAASTPGGALLLNGAETFDLQSYLRAAQRPDLAQLAVSAAKQGSTLTLEGIVPSFEAQQAIIELAQSAPGVTEVNTVNLLLRLPPTYVVQPGDTLWDITYRFYGNVDKMQTLIDANQDILASPSALTVGMELTLPPNE
ncbi:MAG: LysM peptidoglycan-binding domain-containing protein [Caldilineaceae bacterium]